MADTSRAQRIRYARAILQSRSGTEALPGEGDFVDGARVLVLGEQTAEALCAPVHTECLSAESRGPDASVRERSADLILVSHVCLRTLGRVARQAAAAGRPNVRMAMTLGAEHGFAEAAAREMRTMGFDEPCQIGDGGQTRLVTRMAGGSWRGSRRGLT